MDIPCKDLIIRNFSSILNPQSPSPRILKFSNIQDYDFSNLFSKKFSVICTWNMGVYCDI